MEKERLNKYGEKYCILPTCSELSGHDGYYCEQHHSKYYLGKTDSPMPKKSECKNPKKYQNIGIDKNFLNDWQKDFIHEFVNDHGNAWRPLRGLWVDDVLEFISNLLASQEERFKEELSKYKEALIWCSGASDFQLEGKARIGWEKIKKELLN